MKRRVGNIKKITALILSVVLLPFADWADTGILHNEKSVYGEAESVNQKEIFSQNLVIEEDLKLTENMEVESLKIVSGCLDLNGHTLKVNGDVTISDKVKFNQGTLECMGNFLFEENAKCYMRNSEDKLIVNGDFIDNAVTRKYPIDIQNAKMEIGGDFTVGRGIIFAENTEISFCGNEKQIINSETKLGNVHFENKSSEGIEVKKIDCYKSDNIEGCTVIYAETVPQNDTDSENEEEKNVRYIYEDWTLESDEIIEGDLKIYAGVINLNGHTLTVKGNILVDCKWTITRDEEHNMVIGDKQDVVFENGTVIAEKMDVTGCMKLNCSMILDSCSCDCGVIIVGGRFETNYYNYRIGSGIILNKGKVYINESFYGVGMHGNQIGIRMTHPEDYVCISGKYEPGENSSNLSEISNGIFEIKCDGYIDTEGDAVVLMSGDTSQSLRGYASNVIVKNPFIYGVDVRGLECSNITYEENIPAYKGIELTDGYTLTQDVTVSGGYAMAVGILNLNGHTLHIKGDMYHCGGSININGGKLIIDGDYHNIEAEDSTIPEIIMDKKEDYILV